MRKQAKMISIVLLVIMILTSIASTAFAVESAIDQMKGGSVNNNVAQFGGKIVNIVQTVGIIVAVVVILILGIKYMMGSAEEKAEYKKTMIPYLVGAVLIFAASNIVKVVYQLSQELTK